MSQTISVTTPVAVDPAQAAPVAGSRGKPLAFWLYVLAGVVMIIASAIALPFVATDRR
ncbi:hypothetical protein [Sphingomonas sp. CV7422]|uniref:hypothetical protein n=1 Tax=Sphingomonas sp. CV7422 TaxID=3018036 RepID=UPI0022FEE5EB|nr:hypothetical protein [Sphingomonas sp. CV7422]